MICQDALERDESCGCHFREEHQSDDGECVRDDGAYAYVAAWEFAGVGNPGRLHKEPLTYEEVEMATRSYK